MPENLKCFISASYDVDTLFMKNVLSEYDVDALDIYDFSIGDSIQKILKRKIRQSDFAIFIISDNASFNVIYEMGVCEGLGKQYFVFLHNELKIPFYLENQIFFRSKFEDRDFLRAAVGKILNDVDKKDRNTKQGSFKVKEAKQYPANVKKTLEGIIKRIDIIRQLGSGKDLEDLVKDIFSAISLYYAENDENKDRGVDFALWNDDLGKILGNPILVEVKSGDISRNRFEQAEYQILKYIEKSGAKVALLLYLDRQDRRYKIRTSLNPLLISYDIKDFVKELMDTSFEGLVLAQRNKIAHGVE